MPKEQEMKYEEIYNQEMEKLKRRIKNKKSTNKYNKEYCKGYERGISRIYKGVEEVEEKVHLKLLSLKNSTNEKYRELGRGYKNGLRYGENNLIPRKPKKRGRPGLGKEGTKMVGSRIPLSQYKELQKRVKNSSEWIRGLINQELSKN